MMPRATHTFVKMGISPIAYMEIKAKLQAAGYDHVFLEDGGIDMSGIAVVPEKEEVKSDTYVGYFLVPDGQEEATTWVTQVCLAEDSKVHFYVENGAWEGYLQDGAVQIPGKAHRARGDEPTIRLCSMNLPKRIRNYEDAFEYMRAHVQELSVVNISTLPVRGVPRSLDMLSEDSEEDDIPF